MFPFYGGLNGDDPIPDDDFIDLFDDELYDEEEDEVHSSNTRERPGMTWEDLGGDAAWSDGFEDV